MPGWRAYTLVDVLKQIGDQSAPVVGDVPNELQSILLGAATVQEATTFRDQNTMAVTLYLNGPWLWGLAPITAGEGLGVEEAAAVNVAPGAPATVQTAIQAAPVARWNLFQWA